MNTQNSTLDIDIEIEQIENHLSKLKDENQQFFENFDMLLEGEYSVTVGATWGYVYFKHQSMPVSYFIVLKS